MIFAEAITFLRDFAIETFLAEWDDNIAGSSMIGAGRDSTDSDAWSSVAECATTDLLTHSSPRTAQDGALTKTQPGGVAIHSVGRDLVVSDPVRPAQRLRQIQFRRRSEDHGAVQRHGRTCK